jgi:protein-disulfide isomerase
LKKDFVDTGRVRWIVREMAIGNADFAGFVLARCAGTDKAADLIDRMFDGQRELQRTNESPQAFAAFAETLGFNEVRLMACMGKQAIRDAVVRSEQAAQRDFKVTGTPTFFVNGRRLVEADKAEFEAAITAALDGRPD